MISHLFYKEKQSLLIKNFKKSFQEKNHLKSIIADTRKDVWIDKYYIMS